MKEREETSLRSFMDTSPIDVTLFFRLALKVVELVSEWHQHQPFPRGMNPEHITLRMDGEDLTLYWSRIDQEGPVLAYAYMSPEHGGGKTRHPDHRSDLYAIGILLYEWLTGELPFKASSLNEWVHAHMAVKPKPIRSSKPHIPQPISDLVMKLLAKAPEERYQSARGLLDDIRKMYIQWVLSGKIDAIPLGELDGRSQLRLPSQRYGRDREWQQLMNIYARVCSGAKEFLVIGGHAGSGKSTMVRALQEYIWENKGSFIYGKAESIREAEPYAPLIAALSDRIRHILASGDVQIKLWKENIAKALGRSGSLLIQMIPELRWLAGEQPPIEALSPAEATHRFRKLFGNLIQAFASPKHPLVICIDDLQWADPASLHLLRDLWGQSSFKHVMFIGTYRDDEVGEQHGLHPWFQELSMSGEAEIHDMKLHALSYSDVIQFTAAALHVESDEIKPLADILYQQTAGNPLYLKQMVQAWHDQKRLFFDFEQACWRWDLQAIKAMKGFQDVVDLIKSRIETLPAETRLLLQRAGSLGASLDIATISCIVGMDAEQVTHVLSPAVKEGWIAVEKEQLRFQHDQIQKVAYDLITDEEKKQVHLEIGRALLRSIPSSIAEERLFLVVHHMNAGRAYITDPTELDQLASLNLNAGRKAKSSAAYGQALYFLMIGAELGKSEDWFRADGLYFQLVLERSECLYFSGDIGLAETDLRELLQHAHSKSDRSRIYAIMIMMYSFHNRMNEAVDTAVLAMNEFGLSMPSDASAMSLIVEIARTNLVLSRNHKRLEQLPVNHDPSYKALAHIVTVASSVIFIVNPELSIILFAKYVRMSVRQGLGDAFSIALGSYAAAIGFGLGQYRTAARFIEIAWTYAEQSDSLHLRGKVQLYRGLAKQYTCSKEAVVSHFESAAQLSLECGDMGNAGNAMSCHMITCDMDLRRLDQICQTYEAENAQWLDEITVRTIRITEHYIERLRQPFQDQPLLFRIPDMPEQVLWLKVKMTNEEKANWYYLYTCKLEVAFLYNRYSDAITLAEQSIGMTRDVMLNIQQKHCFYFALALMRADADNDRRKLRKRRSVLRQLMKRMRDWTSASSDSLSKYRIMQAEYARMDANYKQALSLYDQAILEAKRNGDSRDEAIAAESAAYVYAALNDGDMHEHYLRAACVAYDKWGATGKVKHLQESVDGLAEFPLNEWGELVKSDPTTEGGLPTTSMHFGTSLSQDLDIEILQQTARTLKGDHSERPISEKFLQLALYTTGAEKGFILLEKEGRFFIHTALEVNQNREDSLEQDHSYSHKVVHFVHRTKEPVILGEARQSMFVDDLYIQHRQPRSILCLPIRDSVHRDGLIYLENNQTSNAFTTDRVDMLELLFSRMIYVKLWQLDDRTDVNDNSKPLLSFGESLTNREMEIVRLMGEGLSNKQIAMRLLITEGTVKIHSNNIYGKLQVNNRVQAINKAKELHLIG